MIAFQAEPLLLGYLSAHLSLHVNFYTVASRTPSPVAFKMSFMEIESSGDVLTLAMYFFFLPNVVFQIYSSLFRATIKTTDKCIINQICIAWLNLWIV